MHNVYVHNIESEKLYGDELFVFTENGITDQILDVAWYKVSSCNNHIFD